MSKRDVRLYLTDIDDAITTIQSYTQGITYEQLVDDRRTREAIILNFVVIGEAIKKIPPDIIEMSPDVPWNEFSRMRDKMVHSYFSISITLLWATIQHDLIPLEVAVKELLKEYS
ncbi:MAG: DUF86 domain-containing protein [Methanoregula sp.]